LIKSIDHLNLFFVRHSQYDNWEIETKKQKGVETSKKEDEHQSGWKTLSAQHRASHKDFVFMFCVFDDG